MALRISEKFMAPVILRSTTRGIHSRSLSQFLKGEITYIKYLVA